VISVIPNPRRFHSLREIDQFGNVRATGSVKGKLSLRLFQRYERVGKRYWGRHLWSRGYCVSTVGLTEELIRRYVKHQEKMDKQIEEQQKGLFK